MASRTADILYKDQLAGSLTETAGGGTRFTYASGWNNEIACCFPAVRREHEWTRGLHPFFEHLAPEGWLREQQARVAHVLEEDDLGLLLRYGADCIGAGSLRPPGDLAPAPEITEATASPGRTVSGIQKKLLVVKEGNAFRPAPPQGLAPYIAKFNSERIQSLVRNEALSLRWTAAVLGANEVTKFELAHVSVVEEQALVVTQLSVRPSIDLLRFYRRLLVFALIGNCDAHLRNFSLLETPAGLRLSPVYDVLNTAIYDGLDQALALTIGGRRVRLDEADQSLFRRFGLEIGLPKRAVDQAFVALERQVRKAAPIIAPPAAESPDGFRNRFAEIVTNACLRMFAR